MNSNPLVLKEPAATAGVQNLADGSVAIYANSWVETANWASVKASHLENIKNRFEQEGVALPVSLLNVNLNNTKAAG